MEISPVGDSEIKGTQHKNSNTGVILLLAAASSVAALAQTSLRTDGDGSGVDVSGTWYYDDHQDAAYGTAAGACRLRRISLERSRALVHIGVACFADDGAPAAVRRLRNSVRVFSPGNYRYWEERSLHQQINRHPDVVSDLGDAQDHLDGRAVPILPPTRRTLSWILDGEWKGNVLTITTTHLKRVWLRGNGTTSSDEAHVIERLIRHGDRLTFLHRPSIRSFWMSRIRTTIIISGTHDPDAWLYACEDAQEI